MSGRSGYARLALNDHGKTIIPCYEDMSSAGDIPAIIRNKQAQIYVENKRYAKYYSPSLQGVKYRYCKNRYPLEKKIIIKTTASSAFKEGVYFP